ncbi:MAG: hypothetical protein RJB15_1724, partial [Pseudomonadota bacterium]
MKLTAAASAGGHSFDGVAVDAGAAATTVSGATTGILAGGLIGALTGLGVSDNDAHHYEESIRSGGVLVAIPAQQGDSVDALSVLDRYEAQQVRTISTTDKSV